MWFPLALVALSMLVVRRTAEKTVTSRISSLAMAWLQQAFALPFIILSLFFARFYWPAELSHQYWLLMAVYVFFGAVDIICYFKAISLADISYVAPLMTLVSVGNVLGAYFVLGQPPSVPGLAGAALIVVGAALTYNQKRKETANTRSNKLALLLVLVLVGVRSYYSNIEVLMVRESNPTTFNFYSSLLTVPFIIVASLVVILTNRSGKYSHYWRKVGAGVRGHRGLLIFIGLTYTINMIATYSAKVIAPNAGYVGALKSSSVLPMVLVGLFFFKEKVVAAQWLGLVLIAAGLVALAMN